jgi:mannose-1-phosphate guanylyltransferase
MAGGSGTRLWPLSRKNRPKQALPLMGEKTMFQTTVERLQPLIPTEKVFVVTNQTMAEIFKEQVPSLPHENYIIEPYAKDSGPAAALGIAHIHKVDPDAVIAILTADHHIGKELEFREILYNAGMVARAGAIVTLGIVPTHPSTGFGYIERGDLCDINSINKLNGKRDAKRYVYDAVRFTEKPPLEKAIEYFQGGRHWWNSGMFVLTSKTGWAEFFRQQPEFAQALQEVADAIGTDNYEDKLRHAWAVAPKKSLDYAIMEGARQIAVIPVDIGWSDIGSWASLLEIMSGDENGNVVLGEHISIDTNGSLVRGGHRVIATIGVSDLVIIDTLDALLICTKDRVQEVKSIVDRLKDKKLDSYL